MEVYQEILWQRGVRFYLHSIASINFQLSLFPPRKEYNSRISSVCDAKPVTKKAKKRCFPLIKYSPSFRYTIVSWDLCVVIKVLLPDLKVKAHIINSTTYCGYIHKASRRAILLLFIAVGMRKLSYSSYSNNVNLYINTILYILHSTSSTIHVR